MLSAIYVVTTESGYPPHVLELQASMCQIAQVETPDPIACWILEEGQLLGVLVASDPLFLN